MPILKLIVGGRSFTINGSKIHLKRAFGSGALQKGDGTTGRPYVLDVDNDLSPSAKQRMLDEIEKNTAFIFTSGNKEDLRKLLETAVNTAPNLNKTMYNPSPSTGNIFSSSINLNPKTNVNTAPNLNKTVYNPSPNAADDFFKVLNDFNLKKEKAQSNVINLTTKLSNATKALDDYFNTTVKVFNEVTKGGSTALVVSQGNVPAMTVSQFLQHAGTYVDKATPSNALDHHSQPMITFSYQGNSNKPIYTTKEKLEKIGSMYKKFDGMKVIYDPAHFLLLTDPNDVETESQFLDRYYAEAERISNKNVTNIRRSGHGGYAMFGRIEMQRDHPGQTLHQIDLDILHTAHNNLLQYETLVRDDQRKKDVKIYDDIASKFATKVKQLEDQVAQASNIINKGLNLANIQKRAQNDLISSFNSAQFDLNQSMSSLRGAHDRVRQELQRKQNEYNQIMSKYNAEQRKNIQQQAKMAQYEGSLSSIQEELHQEKEGKRLVAQNLSTLITGLKPDLQGHINEYEQDVEKIKQLTRDINKLNKDLKDENLSLRQERESFLSETSSLKGFLDKRYQLGGGKSNAPSMIGGAISGQSVGGRSLFSGSGSLAKALSGMELKSGLQGAFASQSSIEEPKLIRPIDNKYKKQDDYIKNKYGVFGMGIDESDSLQFSPFLLQGQSIKENELFFQRHNESSFGADKIRVGQNNPLFLKSKYNRAELDKATQEQVILFNNQIKDLNQKNKNLEDKYNQDLNASRSQVILLNNQIKDLNQKNKNLEDKYNQDLNASRSQINLLNSQIKNQSKEFEERLRITQQINQVLNDEITNMSKPKAPLQIQKANQEYFDKSNSSLFMNKSSFEQMGISKNVNNIFMPRKYAPVPDVALSTYRQVRQAQDAGNKVYIVNPNVQKLVNKKFGKQEAGVSKANMSIFGKERAPFKAVNETHNEIERAYERKVGFGELNETKNNISLNILRKERAPFKVVNETKDEIERAYERRIGFGELNETKNNISLNILRKERAPFKVVNETKDEIERAYERKVGFGELNEIKNNMSILRKEKPKVILSLNKENNINLINIKEKPQLEIGQSYNLNVLPIKKKPIVLDIQSNEASIDIQNEPVKKEFHYNEEQKALLAHLPLIGRKVLKKERRKGFLGKFISPLLEAIRPTFSPVAYGTEMTAGARGLLGVTNNNMIRHYK